MEPDVYSHTQEFSLKVKQSKAFRKNEAFWHLPQKLHL